jgi:hypothetical protein
MRGAAVMRGAAGHGGGLRLALAGELLVLDAWDLNVDVNASQERATDALQITDYAL